VKESRKPAVVRGFASSTLATFVALSGHVSGGGQMPGPLGIVVPWILSLMLCTLLAGRRLSPVRLTLSVGVSQVLFHTLFVLGTVTPSGGSLPEHVHGAPLVLPSGVGVALPDPVAAHGPMWIGHLCAALITIAALHWGERLVHATRALAVQAVRWLRQRASVTVVDLAPRARRRLHAAFVLAPPGRGAPHLASLRGRAPPASLAI